MRKQTDFQKQRAREANTTHGLSKTPMYRVWRTMQTRCENPAAASFKTYGARGIRVDDRWKDFLAFKAWADLNGWQQGLTIDRIDNDKGYSPENCRIVTRKENNRNRPDVVVLTVKGESLPLTVWAERTGLRSSTIYMRLRRGASHEKAVEPIRL